MVAHGYNLECANLESGFHKATARLDDGYLLAHTCSGEEMAHGEVAQASSGGGRPLEPLEAMSFDHSTTVACWARTDEC